MKTLLIFIFLVIAPHQAKCDLVWITNPINNHQYALTADWVYGRNAEAVAILEGGHLVAINDAAEEQWVYNNFGDSGLNNYGLTSYWIGLYKSESLGYWTWTTGENLTYQNWAIGEPTNAPSTIYGYGSGSGWNDEGGNVRMYAVIEKAAVPIPSAIILLGAGLGRLVLYSRRRLTNKN